MHVVQKPLPATCPDFAWDPAQVLTPFMLSPPVRVQC